MGAGCSGTDLWHVGSWAVISERSCCLTTLLSVGMGKRFHLPRCIANIQEISVKHGEGTLFPKQTVHPLSDTEVTGPKFGTWDSDGQ